jgi:hypothetical protein
MPTSEPLPTADLRPAMGPLIFSDLFNNEDSGWQTSRTAVGSIGYGRQELTLAVSAPRGILVSMRESPQMADFYLEIEAQPSLCRSGDAFGLLLRAASNADFYRLLMNCNGELRMERVMNGRFTVLRDWEPTGQIPPGGMMMARLGVWAAGGDMRIFVNDVHMFSVRDTAMPSGTLGVFARSAGDSPLTVNFSNLKVYQVDRRSIPATQTPETTKQP